MDSVVRHQPSDQVNNGVSSTNLTSVMPASSRLLAHLPSRTRNMSLNVARLIKVFLSHPLTLAGVVPNVYSLMLLACTFVHSPAPSPTSSEKTAYQVREP